MVEINCKCEECGEEFKYTREFHAHLFFKHKEKPAEFIILAKLKERVQQLEEVKERIDTELSNLLAYSMHSHKDDVITCIRKIRHMVNTNTLVKEHLQE